MQLRTRSGTVHALDEIALQVHRGECLGMVGESGLGKSVSAYALMRLLDPDPNACRCHGRCRIGQGLCARAAPPVYDLPGGRRVACPFPLPTGALAAA
jgi:ABC-type glutathione transport system ATPase component